MCEMHLGVAGDSIQIHYASRVADGSLLIKYWNPSQVPTRRSGVPVPASHLPALRQNGARDTVRSAAASGNGEAHHGVTAA